MELLLQHLIFHQVCYSIRLLAAQVVVLPESSSGFPEIVLVLDAARALHLLIEAWAYFCDVHSLDASNIFDLILAKFLNLFDMWLIIVELDMNKLNIRIQRENFCTGEVCRFWTIHCSASHIFFRLKGYIMLV